MIVDTQNGIENSLQPGPAWANVWHLWKVIFPRRSITGRLVCGRVWRRRDGRRWIYKKFSEYWIKRRSPSGRLPQSANGTIAPPMQGPWFHGLSSEKCTRIAGRRSSGLIENRLRAACVFNNQLAGCGEPALRTNLSAFRRT